jgi:hypothetical protein
MTLARDRQGEMRCSKADEKARDRHGQKFRERQLKCQKIRISRLPMARADEIG